MNALPPSLSTIFKGISFEHRALKVINKHLSMSLCTLETKVTEESNSKAGGGSHHLLSSVLYHPQMSIHKVHNTNEHQSAFLHNARQRRRRLVHTTSASLKVPSSAIQHILPLISPQPHCTMPVHHVTPSWVYSALLCLLQRCPYCKCTPPPSPSPFSTFPNQWPSQVICLKAHLFSILH